MNSDLAIIVPMRAGIKPVTFRSQARAVAPRRRLRGGGASKVAETVARQLMGGAGGIPAPDPPTWPRRSEALQ
jgi:hypothetical protein